MCEQGFEVFKGFIWTPYTRDWLSGSSRSVSKPFKVFKHLLGGWADTCSNDAPESRPQISTARNAPARRPKCPSGRPFRRSKHNAPGQRLGQSARANATFTRSDASALRIKSPARIARRASANYLRASANLDAHLCSSSFIREAAPRAGTALTLSPSPTTPASFAVRNTLSGSRSATAPAHVSNPHCKGRDQREQRVAGLLETVGDEQEHRGEGQNGEDVHDVASGHRVAEAHAPSLAAPAGSPPNEAGREIADFVAHELVAQRALSFDRRRQLPPVARVDAHLVNLGWLACPGLPHEQTRASPDDAAQQEDRHRTRSSLVHTDVLAGPSREQKGRA